MDKAAILTKLNLRIGDTDNFTFSSDEKTEAVEEAFRDPYTAEYAWIDTETFSTSTFRQSLPATIDTVDNIYYKISASDFPETLPSDIWSARDGYIRWSRGARYALTDGSTIYIEGFIKLSTEDTINDTTLQEYVINLSIYNTLKTISSAKIYKFTKNDVSVGELIAMRQQAEREVLKYQAKIADRAFVTG